MFLGIERDIRSFALISNTLCYYKSHEGALTPRSKDHDCGGETLGVAIEAVRMLKSPSESERFTIPTKQKSAIFQSLPRIKDSAFLFAKN